MTVFLIGEVVNVKAGLKLIVGLIDQKIINPFILQINT